MSNDLESVDEKKARLAAIRIARDTAQSRAVVPTPLSLEEQRVQYEQQRAESRINNAQGLIAAECDPFSFEASVLLSPAAVNELRTLLGDLLSQHRTASDSPDYPTIWQQFTLQGPEGAAYKASSALSDIEIVDMHAPQGKVTVYASRAEKLAAANMRRKWPINSGRAAATPEAQRCVDLWDTLKNNYALTLVDIEKSWISAQLALGVPANKIPVSVHPGTVIGDVLKTMSAGQTRGFLTWLKEPPHAAAFFTAMEERLQQKPHVKRKEIPDAERKALVEATCQLPSMVERSRRFGRTYYSDTLPNNEQHSRT